MIRTILAGALLCVLTIHAAEARPRHHHYRAETGNGCSDDVMRPCVGMTSISRSSVVRESRTTQRIDRKHVSRELWPKTTIRRAPPGLSHVMTEGAGRVVNWAKPRAWCGWWMRRYLGVANPAGNLARWWAGFGRPAHGPAVGTIVVWAHDRRHGHVGIITGRTADGHWIVKSGNDGHRVRERPRSVAGAIAFRWPV